MKGNYIEQIRIERKVKRAERNNDYEIQNHGKAGLKDNKVIYLRDDMC